MSRVTTLKPDHEGALTAPGAPHAPSSSPAPAPSTSPPTTRADQRVQILAVDDDDISLDALRTTLERDGCDVLTASSGQEALDILNRSSCRIVISDWYMPGFDGLELCRRVRGLGLPEYVYIILVTSKDATDSVVHALSAGADDFLTKPFNPAELRARVRSGERIRRSRNDLEAMVQQRTADLTRSNRELEQFAYVASHDLQEPLRMVSSYLQLLQRRYAEALDAQANEFIKYAVDGASHMKRLIEDLLAYSRLSTRGESFRPIDCEQVVSAALQNLRVAVEEAHAEIVRDALPIVMGDQVQLVQLFQNLIGNSIKYAGPERPPRIRIGAERRDGDGDWLFSVSDNGIGFDPAYAERIFIIFQRLHNREQYSGTGIGLALCKKVVERHGGRIWAESEPGAGSAFRFTLPQVIEDATHDDAEQDG